MALSAQQISVVIPTFNRSGVIRRAIQSVLTQTCPPGEIIVVDDGSSDGTEELITSEFKTQLKYIHQTNRGVSHARNSGIKLAQGSWIAFLDSDDQWQPNKLQLQIEALDSQPGYEFCHTNEIWIRNGMRVNAMNKHEKSGGYIFHKCLPLCVISPSSTLIQKSVFERIGLFDEELPACEDYEMWLRYCVDNPVLYLETPLIVKYGGHDDQLSRKFWGMDRFRLHALLKILSSNSLSEEQSAAALEVADIKLNILMKGAEKHQNAELLSFCVEINEQLQSIRYESNCKSNASIC